MELYNAGIVENLLLFLLVLYDQLGRGRVGRNHVILCSSFKEDQEPRFSGP